MFFNYNNWYCHASGLFSILIIKIRLQMTDPMLNLNTSIYRRAYIIIFYRHLKSVIH